MKLSYAEQLMHPKWDVIRKEVYKRADYRCQLCGKGGVALNAHHSYYEPGKMAWEYPHCSLIALCESCHSKAAHGNPDAAIAAAVAEAESENEAYLESALKDKEVGAAIANQYLAHTIHHSHGGHLTISLSDFNPLSKDYSIESTYDEATNSVNFTVKPIYDGVSAFGIVIGSRSNNRGAIDKILEFAKLLHAENLHGYVKEVFHDTKFNDFDITFDDALEEQTSEARRIFALAYRTLPNFNWFGSVQGRG